MWSPSPTAGAAATAAAAGDRRRQATTASGAISASPLTRVMPVSTPSAAAGRWRRRSLKTKSQLASAMKTPSL